MTTITQLLRAVVHKPSKISCGMLVTCLLAACTGLKRHHLHAGSMIINEALMDCPIKNFIVSD